MKISFLVLFLIGVEATFSQPKPTAWVNDFADMLSPQAEFLINKVASSLAEKTSAQIAVVTLKTLPDNTTIEEYAFKLFEQWGIGEKGKDNGVLFLVAKAQRKVRIEVGYGLEDVLPDALCGRLLDNFTLPYFKIGDFDSGIMVTTMQLADVIAKKYNVKFNWEDIKQAYREGALPKKEMDFGWVSFLWPLLLGILFLSFGLRSLWFGFPYGLFSGSLGRPSYWYGSFGGGFGGGFSGGFSGFGGGLSGGGGATRGW